MTTDDIDDIEDDVTARPLTGDAVLVRTLPAGASGLRRYRNTLVLRGPGGPIVVGTGHRDDRDRWWPIVEALVAPDPIAWIVVSHDADDQHGNLTEALDRHPGARILATATTAEALTAAGRGPSAGRWRLVADGDELDLAGRAAEVVRPPAYGSPGSCGLLDRSSGVYWAADCFGAAVPHPVDDVSQLDLDVWADGLAEHHRRSSPWLADLDPDRWHRSVDRVAALGAEVIVGANGPPVLRPDVPRAVELLRELGPEPRSAAAPARTCARG